MTKDHRQKKTTSSTTTMVILAFGGIVVLALVGWALTRSMAPQAATVAPPVAGTETGASIPTPAAPPTDDHNHEGLDAVKRTTVDELKALVDAGNVTVIDVRDANSFAAGHIPGSIHIPMARIEAELGFLPKTKPIVAYCT